MVAHAALAIVAVLALTGGLSAAAATGAFMTSSGNINLGTLVPGQAGNVTATASLHVTNASAYNFQLEKEDRIGGSFSTFAVSVSVNGHTYNLSSEHNDSHLNLSSGTYSFTLHLSYVVKDHAASANVSKAAFLFLHPIGNDSVDHEVQGTSTDSSVHYASASDTGQSHQNNSTRLTLFTVTFKVSGVNQSSHEDQSQGVSNKDSIMVSLP